MKAYNEIYSEYLDLINNKINSLDFDTVFGSSVVCNAMRYSLENGGKRIRPVLVLEACRICGGDIQSALNFAVALECIHTYSLIHDDLPCMDNDDMRRGKPSCHIKFGEEFALLAGDGLLTYAFNLIADSNISADKKSKAVLALAQNAGFNGMIGGQEIDLASENKEISFERLQMMHRLKTGALIRCAVKLGCIAADADEEKVKALTDYADNLGLAFQIIDDILDVEGNADELGKPIGSDKESGKTTYVTLFGLEKAKEMAKKATLYAINAISNLSSNNFLVSLAESLSVRKS